MFKKIKFIIPSIITLIILLIIFYFQGLYPFTNNSIVQVDADYQFIPVLYRIYDFLHGNANIIYDDIGNGNNIYVSMTIQGSIFSPLSLLLYFTDRSNIPCFYNILVIVKICLISLTTYIYINKSFKIKEYYKIVFSILYAFSGWILLNYFNIMWLDSVILFPLIIMYLNSLLANGKYLGYVITLSMSLMISYYISYFILLFILFYSFIYIFLKLDNSKIKKTIFKLGICTIVAMLISSFSLLPTLYQTIVSSRFSYSSSEGEIFVNIINKSLYLMLSSVFLVIFIMMLTKFKKDKKNIYIYILLLLLFLIGLFIEPINLGLHMGSYWSFPYRYSFVTLFILMNGSLYYIEKFGFKEINCNQKILFTIFVLLGILVVKVNNSFYDNIVDSQIVLDFNNGEVYEKIVIIFLLLVIMILVSISFKNNKFRYISFSIVCLLQIFIYSSWTMYYSDGYFLTKNSSLINNSMNLDRDSLSRYKMGYIYYTPDYGYIYDVNTLDNWLHILPNKEVEAYRKLGYKNTDTCVRSYGGTIFTDWLFNVGYLIDDYYIENNMYELIDSKEGYNLYKYNYNNGFGYIYNKTNELDDYEYMEGFYLQNKIYRNLFNKKNNLIKIDEYEYDTTDNVVLNYEINELGFLYLNLYYEVDYIKVNDNYIDFEGSNYIVDLGMYDSDVVIEIGFDSLNYFNFSLGFIKYDDIMNLDSNVNNVTKIDNGYDIEVSNDLDNGYLFLPINNISGLRAYVNGKSVNIDSYMDNFVSIKLDKGNNKVEIRYEMPLFKLGIILSILGIIGLIFINKIPYNKIILNITYYIYIIVCILFYLYFYGYSFLKYYNWS